MTQCGPATELQVRTVLTACERHGRSAIIALSGVPGTSKSHIALIAAQRWATDPLCVLEIQFHPAYNYHEFIEGLRIGEHGQVIEREGVFLEWNQRALDDPSHRYVLLIEEFSRANVPSVLGELLTYVEHRQRAFRTLYSHRFVQVAPNLTIIATFNPTDRSALALDAAILRRLQIVPCAPSVEQLDEILSARGLASDLIGPIKRIFIRCQERFPDSYEVQMPFGHSVFAQIENEHDLYDLWYGRLIHMLRRPLLESHPFTEVIEAAYLWR